jgi:hypothetical protein
MDERVAAGDERRCYIHVGTHKTGTTAIQRFLAANAAVLAARGTHYPRAGRLSESFPGHHNAAFELFGDPRFDPALGTFAEIVAEIAASRAPRACISSEDLEYLYRRPPLLAAARDALLAAGYRPVIVVYVRAQGDYLESLYAETVKFGGTLGFDAFVDDVLHRGVARFANDWGLPFQYSRIADGFASVFGDDGMIVRPYVRGRGAQAVIRDFVGIVAPLARAEVSFQDAAFEHTRPSTGEVIGWLCANSARALKSAAVEHVAERFASSSASQRPFRALSAQQRARVAARFADDNRALAARFGFDAGALADRGGDASDLPERELFVAAEAARRAAMLAATASRSH